MLSEPERRPAPEPGWPSSLPGEEWTLKEVVWQLRAGLRLIAAAVGAALVAGLVYLLLATPTYTATMRVAPVDAGREPAVLQRLALLLPGEAAGRPSEFAEFLALLRSERLARLLDERYRLRQRFFAYDEATKRFVPPSNPVAVAARGLRWLLGLPAWSPPSAAQLAELLAARVAIADTGEAGIREVRFADPDPAFAEALLGWMYAGSDELLRAAQRQKTERYIAFVTDQLQAEQNIEMRAALRSVLLQQTQNRVMTHVDVPFAAKLLDGPYASPLPTSPRIGRTLLIALVTGLGLGIVLVFLRAALR